MFEKLKLLKNQYEQLCARMELPETYADPALYSRYERECRELAVLTARYYDRSYHKHERYTL